MTVNVFVRLAMKEDPTIGRAARTVVCENCGRQEN